MQLIQQILEGSVVSPRRLLEARQFYAPQGPGSTPEAEFARCTGRVAVQTDLGGARELAGLSDAELSALQAEFVRFPVRRRSDRFRHAFRASAALFALGGLGLAFQAVAGGADVGWRALQLASLAAVVAGVAVAIAGLAVAFQQLPLDLAHGNLGLLVGTLDEQHPWLYETLRLARHPEAEAYRQHVLRERGPLRGVDHVLMKELVRGHELLERAQWARSVAEQLQRAVPPADNGAAEPRLVRVAARH